MRDPRSGFDYIFPLFLRLLTTTCAWGWWETGHFAFGVVTIVAVAETIWSLWILDWL